MLSIIIFLILIIAIGYFLVHIKVIHISKLPLQNQKELNDRTKIRSALLSDYIKCDDSNPESGSRNQAKKTNPTISDLQFDSVNSSDMINDNSNGNHNGNSVASKAGLNADKIRNIIEDNNVDDNVGFNIPSLPVKTRHPTNKTTLEDKRYHKKIREDISNWDCSPINSHVTIRQFQIVIISETECESMVKSIVEVNIGNKTYFFETVHYGNDDKCEISKNFFKKGRLMDNYNVKMVSIKSISRKQFDMLMDTCQDRYNDK